MVIHAKSHSLKVDCDLLAVMLLHSHALTISVTIIHAQELRVNNYLLAHRQELLLNRHRVIRCMRIYTDERQY